MCCGKNYTWSHSKTIEPFLNWQLIKMVCIPKLKKQEKLVTGLTKERSQRKVNQAIIVISLNPNIFPDSLSGKRRAPVPTKWTLLLEYRMIMLKFTIFSHRHWCCHRNNNYLLSRNKILPCVERICPISISLEDLTVFFSHFLTRTLLLLSILYIKKFFIKHPRTAKFYISEIEKHHLQNPSKHKKPKPLGYSQCSSELSYKMSVFSCTPKT